MSVASMHLLLRFMKTSYPYPITLRQNTMLECRIQIVEHRSARIHYERALEMNPSHNDLNSNLELLIANRLNDQFNPCHQLIQEKNIVFVWVSQFFWMVMASDNFWTIGSVLFIVRMMNWMPQAKSSGDNRVDLRHDWSSRNARGLCLLSRWRVTE